MTLAEFNAKADKEVVIIAEIVPKQSLEGWTSGSPSTTYDINFDNFVAVDIDPMYRTIDVIVVNDSELTEAANQAAVDSTPGTFFYDEPNTTIYVQLLDSSDPDDSSVVFARFRMYFATKGIVFDDIYHSPRLTPEGLPTVTDELEDLLFGVVKLVGSGTINLTNGDKAFDKISQLFSWKNGTVNLFYGGDDLARSDYAAIGTNEIEDFTPGFDDVSIFLRDLQKKTLKLVPATPMIRTHIADDGTPSADDFPDMDASKDGTFMPILYGDVAGIAPIQIAGTSVAGTTNTYLIADFNVQELYSIPNVFNDGIQIGSAFIQKSLSGCTFSITSGYTGTTYGEITCDATGPPVQGEAWETSTDYLKTSGEIIADMYVRFAGLTASEISASTFVDSDVENGATHSIYLTEQQTIRHQIRGVERGVLGRVVRNTSGVIQMDVWVPATVRTGLLSVGNFDVGSLEIDLRIESIFSKIIVRYAKTPATGAWKTVVREDNRTRFLHLDGQHVERIVETSLKTSEQAGALASRIRVLTKTPQLFVKIKETGTNLWTVIPGDRILVSIDRAPSLTGLWDEKIMEVVSVTRSFSPPSIELVLNNLWGTSGLAGVWVDDAIVDWSTATDEEKERSGFWTDDSGLTDPSDAESGNRSIWW